MIGWFALANDNQKDMFHCSLAASIPPKISDRAI
jgi:hypothetical protein